jgi:hypothetical protein
LVLLRTDIALSFATSPVLIFRPPPRSTRTCLFNQAGLKAPKIAAGRVSDHTGAGTARKDQNRRFNHNA